MPRECTVCTHPDVYTINERLVGIGGKQSLRNIAKHFDVNYQAVNRHKEHIPEMLARASRAEEVAEADSLLDRLESLQTRAEAILSRAEQTENYGAMLGAVREMRSNLEVIGEVTKELNRQPTLNLLVSPEWLELRTLIIQAVEPFPEARHSILRAIEGDGNGAP
ncbi:MAG: hypothetical protein ICV68_17740 [Pyrinomonadaceae bacterium]|nr:hypothetical protein [Pyrinomonadaceae bacterium]